MAHTFRILFRGFCAFVPRYVGGKPKDLTVLMPYSRKPRRERKGQDHIIPRHASILSVRLGDVAEGNPTFCYFDDKCEEDDKCKEKESSNKRAVFDLSDKLVEVVASTEVPKLKLRGVCKSDDDSVDRILPVRDLCGRGRQAAYPKSKYIQDVGSKLDLLDAQIHLNHGELYCHRLDAYEDSDTCEVVPVEWHWHPQNIDDPKRVGKLAVEVGFEIKTDGRPVEFRLSSLGEVGVSELVRFYGDRDIEVIVAHSEIEKMLGLEYDVPCAVNGVLRDSDVRGFIEMTRDLNCFTVWQDVWYEWPLFLGSRHGICKSVMFDHPDSTY